MKTVVATAFSFAATIASAHPGHGSWFHSHQDELIEVAMIVVACLIAVVAVRAFWKVLSRP